MEAKGMETGLGPQKSDEKLSDTSLKLVSIRIAWTHVNMSIVTSMLPRAASC